MITKNVRFPDEEDVMHRQSHSRPWALLRVLTIAAGTALFILAPLGSASAYTEKALHSFCTEQTCGDGAGPQGSLLRDRSGNLYGTTVLGGKYGEGLVFKLVPNGDPYKEYILHNFCAQANCPDGGTPESGLIIDVDGNLYGTAAVGGKHGGGVVFKLTHGANGWSYRVIKAFCSEANCADGNWPTGLAYFGQAAGAPWDEFSPLFGTALGGGVNNEGVAYKLASDGSLWNYEVIHSFNAPDNYLSAYPGPPLVDSSGNLFGVTQLGGKYGSGVLYRLAAGTWKETTLHNFCAEANCADGSYAAGQLAMDAAGNLFGVTEAGGSTAYCKSSLGCGVAFERSPGGPYTVIYNFCSLYHCKDGGGPPAGMTMDAVGNLLGTTAGGGKPKEGTVFELSPGVTWTERVLYNFCSEQNCTDGASTFAPVIMDSDGNLYGTTYGGGANGAGGTVFELTP